MFPPNPTFPHDLDPFLHSLSNQEKYNFHFNYLQMNNYQCEFLFRTYNNPPDAVRSPIMQNIVTTINQDFVRKQQKFSERSGLQQCEDGNDDLLDAVISSYKKKMATSKKDGKRKINTAHGPRDRRVRFSTEIARKFFGLQDLLGFDRASKTLDWLLTNSVTAIKELVEETNHDSSDQSSLKFLETIIQRSDENINDGNKMSIVKCVDGKKTKTRRKCEAGSFRVNNAARNQLRAEARERARERTRKKMLVKKLDDDLLVSDSNLTLMKSGGCWSEIEPEISDYRNIRCECIMDRETTSKRSKDSSFLYTTLYQNLEHHFMTTIR